MAEERQQRGVRVLTGVALGVIVAGLAGCLAVAPPAGGVSDTAPGRVGETAGQTVRDHPQTAAGAGVGAAGGAVIGGLAGGTRGAVIGGLVGALAGGAVGHYLERREGGSAGAGSGYRPDQAPALRLDRVQVSPALASPGSTVHLDATYTVMAPGDRVTTVRETREVRYAGERVANPTVEVQRTPGTFTTSLPITLPPATRPGAYEVTTTVAMGDQRASQTSVFQVR